MKVLDDSLKVSIIVPVYNVEKYLEECLQSIKNQSYKNIEVVIVDDGSPDKSHEIAQKFVDVDGRFKLIQQENRGLNGARETGFKHSAGSWIVFVDSDDVVHPDYVANLLYAATAYNTQIAVARHRIFTEEVLATQEHVDIEIKAKSDYIGAYLLEYPFMPDFFMQTAWGKIYARELVEQVVWEKSAYRINEDEFMSTMLYGALNSDVAVVNKQLYFYRQNRDSIMSGVKKTYVNSYQGQPVSKCLMLERVTEFRLETFGDGFANEIFCWLRNQLLNQFLRARENGLIKIPNTEEREIFARHLDEMVAASEIYQPSGYWAVAFSYFTANGVEKIADFVANSPLVSVIVPIYNAQEFLHECLDSIADQVYANLDILLINDGSKDASASICDEFAAIDSRVRVFHRENNGVSVTRNFGVAQASGEFVMFVDADDFISPTCVSDCIEYVLDNQEVDVVAAKVQIYVDANTNVHTWHQKIIPENQVFSWQTDTFNTVLGMMIETNYPVGKLFRRNFLQRHKIEFPVGVKFGEDLEFVTKALMLARGVVVLSNYLYSYRQPTENNFSATGTFSLEKMLDLVAVLNSLEIFFETEIADSNARKAFEYAAVSHSIYAMEISEKDPDLQKEIFEYIHMNLVPRFCYEDATFPFLRQSHIIEMKKDALVSGKYKDWQKACLLKLYDNELDRMGTRGLQESVNLLNAHIKYTETIDGAIKNLIRAIKRKLSSKH